MTDGIARVERDGVVDGKGVKHPADTIVMATGFQVTSFLSHLNLVGDDGVALADKWRDPDNVEAYYGTLLSGLPNVAVLMGPNTALGHSSMIFIIETQVRDERGQRMRMPPPPPPCDAHAYEGGRVVPRPPCASRRSTTWYRCWRPCVSARRR